MKASFYEDDYLTSFAPDVEAITFAADVSTLLAQSGIGLRRLADSSLKVAATFVDLKAGFTIAPNFI